MLVRLAIEADFDQIVAMARANIDETRSGRTFDERQCRKTLQCYIETALPTIFVAEDKRQIVGFLLAGFYEHRAASGLFTTQEVLYVIPEKRGSRAAVSLMKHFIAWSETLGANEIIGGNDNGFKSERTARFLEHLGFERVGYSMRRVVTNGR